MKNIYKIFKKDLKDIKNNYMKNRICEIGILYAYEDLSMLVGETITIEKAKSFIEYARTLKGVEYAYEDEECVFIDDVYEDIQGIFLGLDLNKI